MKDIKLIIDGKEITLTEEQIKVLNLKENEDIFKRVNYNKLYYYIGQYRVYESRDTVHNVDNRLHILGNYFKDKNFAVEQFKRETLNRLLIRFSYKNGMNNSILKNEKCPKYYIYYNPLYNYYDIEVSYAWNIMNTPYFTTKEIAKRAIDEIIIPFEKGELDVCKLLEE